VGNAANLARKARAVSGALIAAAAVFGASAVAAECPAPEAMPTPEGTVAFKQTRALNGVGKPIVSTGDVTVSPDVVVWRVTKPVEIVTRIAETGVTQSVAGGPPKALGAGGSAAFLSETGLSDLLRQDFTKIGQRYDVERGVRTGAPGWAVALKPKDKRLAPYVKQVSFESCRRLEWIEIDQPNGDKIRVDFAGP
jgi:hypothetical protein